MTLPRPKLIADHEFPQWDAFITQHPNGTIYHHSAWKEVIEKTYGYQPYYIALQNDSGDIEAGLPLFYVNSPITGKRLVSIPFSDVGGPVFDDYGRMEEIINYLQFSRLAQKSKYIEIRASSACNHLNGHFLKFEYYKNFILRLQDNPQALFKTFHKNHVQRAIKKAEKTEIKIKVGYSENDFKQFYHLNLLTRKKHGVPPQPYQFFFNLFDIMFKKRLATLMLATIGGQAIAGILLFKFKDTVYYKFGASDFRYLSYRPNHLLMWSAIKMACQEGYEYFDFGKTSPDNKGLMEFKSRWNTSQTDLNYFFFPSIKGFSPIKEASLKYNILSRIWQKLPLSLYSWGSTILYKHLG